MIRAEFQQVFFAYLWNNFYLNSFLFPLLCPDFILFLFRFLFIFIRDRRPLSARGSNNSDSIEDYIRNWKKNDSGTSPLHSPGIESVK